MKNPYLLSILERVRSRDPHEVEYIQSVTEVLSSLEGVIEARPDIVKAACWRC